MSLIDIKKKKLTGIIIIIPTKLFNCNRESDRGARISNPNNQIINAKPRN